MDFSLPVLCIRKEKNKDFIFKNRSSYFYSEVIIYVESRRAREMNRKGRLNEILHLTRLFHLVILKPN